MSKRRPKRRGRGRMSPPGGMPLSGEVPKGEKAPGQESEADTVLVERALVGGMLAAPGPEGEALRRKVAAAAQRSVGPGYRVTVSFEPVRISRDGEVIMGGEDWG